MIFKKKEANRLPLSQIYNRAAYSAVLRRVVAFFTAASLAEAVAVLVAATLTRPPEGIFAVVADAPDLAAVARGLRAGFSPANYAATLLTRGLRAGFFSSSKVV